MNFSFGQSKPYLDSLNYYLFEKVDSVPYTYSFKYHDTVYNIKARYKDQRYKFNEITHITCPKNSIDIPFTLSNPSRADIISFYCEKLRETRDTSIIGELKNILLKQEELFLNEWEPTYRNSQYMYDLQYEILMSLDLTLTYFQLQNKSETEKYKYMKGLYMLQWGDKKKSVLLNSLFHSNYIWNFLNYACYTTKLCSPSLIVQMCDEIGDAALEDIIELKACFMTDQEKQFVLGTLLSMLRYYKSDRFEKTIINRIATFDSLRSIDFSKEYHLMDVYRVFCQRGNSLGLDFLISDAIEPKSEGSNSPWYITQIVYSNKYGKQKALDELTKRILKKDKNLDHYIRLLKNCLSSEVNKIEIKNRFRKDKELYRYLVNFN